MVMDEIAQQQPANESNGTADKAKTKQVCNYTVVISGGISYRCEFIISWDLVSLMSLPCA
jgi:hypothetical protein